MHCRSCEILIEEALMKISGVTKVNVSENNGTAEIFCDRDIPENEYAEAVKSAGYSLGTKKKPLFSKHPQDYVDIVKSAVILFILYVIASKLGIFGLSFTKSADYSSLPVVFLIGLTAGLSTCMALVGGLVLAVSSKFAPGKFKPHIFFNLGRAVLFSFFGAGLGLLGSVFQFSLTAVGLLTIFVGITMLVLGIQTLGIFHFMDRVKLTLPKGLYKILGIHNYEESEYTNKGAFILGGLTFFLPCGFTQAMQLFAMTSGSPLTGALTMGVFALGTTPGLLGIGGLTSIVKQKTSGLFFKIVGLLVILLSSYNISNGLNLSGLRTLKPESESASGITENCDIDTESAKTYEDKYGTKVVCTKGEAPKKELTASGEVQLLKSIYTVKDDMQPSSFTVKVGQPVRLEVEAKEDGSGCMGSLALPGLAKKYETFKKGLTTVMEFTPTKKGSYQITCAMGVPRGTLTVL